MAGLLAGLLVSCEDKALAAKSREQKALIAELEAEVNMLEASMGDVRPEDPAPGLEAVEKGLEDARRNEEELRSEIERLKAERAQVSGGLSDELAAARGGLAEARGAWEDYKNQYRSAERSGAVGEVLEDLKTRDGRVFKKVTIR